MSNIVWIAEGASISVPMQGIKLIETIKSGDVVLDHNKTARKVLSVETRPPLNGEQFCKVWSLVSARFKSRLVMSAHASVLGTPCYTSATNKWFWVPVQTIDFEMTKLVISFNDGLAFGVVGERSQPFTKGTSILAPKVYALRLEGREQSCIANGIGVKLCG